MVSTCFLEILLGSITHPYWGTYPIVFRAGRCEEFPQIPKPSNACRQREGNTERLMNPAQAKRWGASPGGVVMIRLDRAMSGNRLKALPP